MAANDDNHDVVHKPEPVSKYLKNGTHWRQAVKIYRQRRARSSVDGPMETLNSSQQGSNAGQAPGESRGAEVEERSARSRAVGDDIEGADEPFKPV